MISLITMFAAPYIHLLDEFIKHYKKLNIENFCICLHILPSLNETERQECLQTAADILEKNGLNLFAVCYADYFEETLTEFKDQVRRSLCKENEWILWCDADELQEYKTPIPELINELKIKNAHALGGVLFDRLRRARDGNISNERSLWENYPVGANVTQYILGAVVQKIVLAHKGVRLGLGNHLIVSYDEGLIPDASVDYIVPIHHFKWDDSVSDRLRLRLENEQKTGCKWWVQSARALDWLTKDNFLAFEGLETYDFADDKSEIGSGPFSKNPAYTGGPYWSSYRHLALAESPVQRGSEVEDVES